MAIQIRPCVISYTLEVTFTVNLGETTIAAIKEIIYSQGKIAAIKYVRDLPEFCKHLYLRDAKDLVETIARDNGIAFS